MSDSSHSGEGLAEDGQDVVGQPVAGVLEQEPDHPLHRGAQVGQGLGGGACVPIRATRAMKYNYWNSAHFASFIPSRE